MSKKTLQELSKFASGLIAADFICGLWLLASHLLPMSFLGITVTQRGAIGWMIFDVLFFAILVHFGWRSERPRTNPEKLFHQLAGVIFALVALLHLSRLVFGWQLVVGPWIIPYWLNGIGVVIAIFLSYASFRLSD